MPDNLTPGARAILNAREALSNGARRVGQYIGNTVRGLQGAIPGSNRFDWRQAFDVVSNPWLPGNWYDSQTGRWQNPLTGTDTRFGPGRPAPHTGAPLANQPANPGPASGLPAFMDYGDPNAVGPPEYLAGAAPSIPQRNTGPRASPSSGAGRMGGQTIVTDNPNTRTNEAGDFARGFAPTAMQSSTVGRDQLMSTRRAN
jgi:hypothetical protein